jgi:hypothetical protein
MLQALTDLVKSSGVELTLNSLFGHHALLINGHEAILDDAPKLHTNTPKMRAHARIPIGIFKFIKLGRSTR